MNNVLDKLFAGMMISVSFFVAGCSEQEDNRKAADPPMVQLYTTGVDDAQVIRHFVARVDALSTVNLAFQVPGRINELVDKQGIVVPEGDLLAALAPQDYELALKQASASYRKAKSDFGRAQQLKNDDYISQSDFDSLKTAFENAELAVESARLNVDYTRLHAPFDALITNRLVENYSYVQPNQPVLRVQNISYLRVHVNVPEQLMRYAVEENPAYQVYLEDEDGELMSGPDNKPVRLQYLEHKTEVNSATQTYQVTFKLPRSERLELLPGMVLTARVMVSKSMTSPGVWVPTSALDTSGKSEFGVWIYTDNQVRYMPVEVGTIREDMVEIVQGLDANIQIVSAGVDALEDGMEVAPFNRQAPLL